MTCVILGNDNKKGIKQSHKNSYQLTKDGNKRCDFETSIRMEGCRETMDVTRYGARGIMVTFKLDCIAHPGFLRWCQVFAFQAVSYFAAGIFIGYYLLVFIITFLEFMVLIFITIIFFTKFVKFLSHHVLIKLKRTK